MPSPFPGMDPWLEHPAYWPDVHHHLISAIQASLSEQVRPRYVARVEERVYISDDRDPGRRCIIPDVHVAESRAGGEYAPGSISEGGVAVAEPLVRVTLLDKEIHEAYVTLVDVDKREVVTVIEVLSPTNKCPNAEGQKSYLRKRHEVMGSRANFVEIDLLRDGERILAEPGLPDCEYIAHISRPGHRPEGLIWPIRLNQRLPVLPVPLRPEEEDVPLDLQSALASFYDRAGYDLILDSGADPIPPLTGEWSAWAQDLLRTRGIRE